MDTQTQPAAGGAATAQTTGRIDAIKGRIEKLGTVATILGGIGAVLVAGVGTAGGWVQSSYDWLTSASQTTSQITAFEDRMKAVEAFKTTVETDRAEAAKLARVIETTVDELARQGRDVAALRDLQRQTEMKLERLDGILDVLRERVRP